MNTFKNWHKAERTRRTKNKELHFAFAVKVRRYINTGMELTFTDTDNNEISFYLNDETKKLLFMNIDRFIHNKENVKREDYGLEPM